MAVQNPATYGQELGYAQVTSDVTSITSTSFVAITGLILSNLPIPADRPVVVKVFAGAVSNATATDNVQFALFDNPATVNYGSTRFDSAIANAKGPIALEVRFAAGACPANLQAYVKVNAGTGTINATNPFAPAFIQALSC